MLLLLDLDNTLIDRTAAFKTWAQARFGAAEVPWLVEEDRDGYRRREELAGLIAARYRLDAADMLAELRKGMVDQLSPDPRVAAALTGATAAGFVPVVVTNGTVAQQEAKLRRTGLDRLVAAWVVSEGAGVRKPDLAIFEQAAAAVGRRLDEGGWMVGDHAEYDIGGGAAAGLRTGWVSAGREWPATLTYRPTVTASDCATLLDRLRAEP
ncbi:HAD family hydrolase [Paractinoplanes lichenicola]|uniref:HAD family hydrolase n=1 Tax=Paractinoplanes lichenicola TaxID=2802976 RepID=A0ABS1W1Q6_9ACTN|nr:HAD family hydrolase [Actinoplanes lichenicola]MBL7260669.1 HAD family hydrolase [Actinoplanes lichenicola]